MIKEVCNKVTCSKITSTRVLQKKTFRFRFAWHLLKFPSTAHKFDRETVIKTFNLFLMELF